MSANNTHSWTWMAILLLTVFATGAQADDWTYDITRFYINNGSTSMEDTFSDNVEPDSGPYGSSTYQTTNGSYSSDAETGGNLEMRSTDAAVTGDQGQRTLFTEALHSNIRLGANVEQTISGHFEFNNGSVPDSQVEVGIRNTAGDLSPAENIDDIFVGLSFTDPGLGGVFFYYGYADEAGDEFDMQYIDVTGAMSGFTEAIVQIEISDTNSVSAYLDIGANGGGSWDVSVADFTSLNLGGPAGDIYAAGFGAGDVFQSEDEEEVPVPASVWLLLSGLALVRKGLWKRG